MEDQPEQMGAKASPVTLVGYLCKLCDEALTHVGALGPTALERAPLVAHLEPSLVGMLEYNSMRIPGQVGWAAEKERSAPNTSPWGHLADISELPGLLRAALGG